MFSSQGSGPSARSSTHAPPPALPRPPRSSSPVAALPRVCVCARQVGSTVKACTKGIWLCARPDASRPDTTVLFLDTEGLSSTSRSESYDARVFALALLLSSYFVYNSVGTVDGAWLFTSAGSSWLLCFVVVPHSTRSGSLGDSSTLPLPYT